MIYSRHTPHYLQNTHYNLLIFLAEICAKAFINTRLFVSTERTRLSPLWLWESSVKTKSRLPYSRLRTGGTHSLCLLLCHTSRLALLLLSSPPCSHDCVSYLSSSGTSTTLVGCCQVPSKWTAVLCSSTRSSFHHYPTSRQEEVSFTQNILFTINSFESLALYSKKKVLTIKHLSVNSPPFYSFSPQLLFPVSSGFYPFLKIYQSLQLVYTSGV